MSLLKHLSELRNGAALGRASDEQISAWSLHESDSQVARNAHRLNQGLELAALLQGLRRGEKGALMARFEGLTGRSDSLLYNRAAVARGFLAALEEAGEVSRKLETSLLDVPWSELPGAVRAALGLPVKAANTSSSGGEKRLADLWTGWLDNMDSMAGERLEDLRLLEELLAARLKEISARRAEAEAMAAESPAAEPTEEPTEEPIEEDDDEPSLVVPSVPRSPPAGMDGESRDRDLDEAGGSSSLSGRPSGEEPEVPRTGPRRRGRRRGS